MIFANYLTEELKNIGLSDVVLDKNGYVMATLPSNIEKLTPTIGFIAHLDTSPDMSGRKVSPQIIKKYDGTDIVLNQEENIVLKTTDFLKYEISDKI
jgi:tripeptide aminopeptidase